MLRATAFSLAILLISLSTSAHAALKAQADGWEFGNIPPDSFMARILGPQTKSVMVKIVAPDQEGPNIRIIDVLGDASKLNSNVESWRQVILVNLQSKPAILNERVVTINGQQRYFVEFQTDSGSESMLQTAVMAFVMNGKIYKMLYENRQAIYRFEIVDVRKVFETVKLTVE